MFKKFRNAEVVEPLDPYSKLSNDIKKTMHKNITITAIDILSIVSTPIIASVAIDKVSDDFGKKALKISSGVIMAYQVGKIVSGINKTKSSISAYNASLKMIEPEFIEPTCENANIELSESDWEVKLNEDEFNNSSDDDYNFVIHVGEELE